MHHNDVYLLLLLIKPYQPASPGRYLQIGGRERYNLPELGIAKFESAKDDPVKNREGEEGLELEAEAPFDIWLRVPIRFVENVVMELGQTTR